jgi:hexosaminidase
MCRRLVFSLCGILAYATFHLAEIAVAAEVPLAVSAVGAVAPRPALIPQPANVEWREGAFAIPANAAIAPGAFTNAARFLSAALNIPVRAGRQALSFAQKDRLPAEGYELEVSTSGFTIHASSDAGAFYALQTLRQLRSAEGALPCVAIRDAPRFQWRGLMLDCSRTFQPLSYLHQTIDRLAAYKMNVLHLHLTDDQGWRLEIKKYPELTQKGARFPERFHEPETTQGFYTQEQMRELVAYAAARHVVLVPEIEMPGHSLAVLCAKPELSCAGGPFEIFPFFKGPSVTPDIYCAGNEAVFDFMSNVLAEVTGIFPSAVIHIGGDEAPKERWMKCPRCQQRLREAGLKDEEQLQAWFNQRIETVLNAAGRRLIGWDEIMAGGLTPGAIVMSWRGTKGGEAAALAGHDAVMSPTSHCYFDYTYKVTSTQKVYSYEPVPATLPADKVKHILGVQANFWSHIDRTPQRVDFQVYPRLLALAERSWSPQSCRDWQDFWARLQQHRSPLARMGVNFNASDM